MIELKKWAIIGCLAIITTLLISVISLTSARNTLNVVNQREIENNITIDSAEEKNGIISYSFIFAHIRGEYETKKENVGDCELILESSTSSMTVSGLCFIYGEGFSDFVFLKIQTDHINIKRFFGKCENGKVNGGGLYVCV